MIDRFSQNSATIQAALDARIDGAIAQILTDACALDCEGSERVASLVRESAIYVIERYDLGADRLREFAVGRYDETVRGLHRDLVIVSASNLVMFVFILGLSLFKGRFAPILVKIAGLAFTSMTIMVAWYVLGQDWITVLIFNAYIGWAHAVSWACCSPDSATSLSMEAAFSMLSCRYR